MTTTLTPSQKIGRLTLIEPIAGKKPTKWSCVCDCGNKREVFEGNLKYRRTQSCGCLREELKVSTMRNAFQQRRPK